MAHGSRQATSLVQQGTGRERRLLASGGHHLRPFGQSALEIDFWHPSAHRGSQVYWQSFVRQLTRDFTEQSAHRVSPGRPSACNLLAAV